MGARVCDKLGECYVWWKAKCSVPCMGWGAWGICWFCSPMKYIGLYESFVYGYGRSWEVVTFGLFY